MGAFSNSAGPARFLGPSKQTGKRKTALIAQLLVVAEAAEARFRFNAYALWAL
jgi:hypothetical protein